ncbi:hypothetical protein KW785_03705 [Candidatus Parcubacteria bacterium]|nr:hypothetical protein [Candidatus Parcubacteria bacterium]
MPKSRIILTLGFIVALLPVLGFPHAWESFFQVAIGLGIVLLSVLISVDKRLMQKAKAERREVRRRTQVGEEAPQDAPQPFGRRATDLPVKRRVVKLGRRATDVAIENVEVPNLPEVPSNDREI